MSDGAAPGDIKKWREAEIKHGRVAMLAALGVLVAEVRTRQRTQLCGANMRCLKEHLYQNTNLCGHKKRNGLLL